MEEKNRVKKRPVDICVISDIHLGTFGCHAKELLDYLNSIEPKVLVMNGDIIDAWQFNKKYFPREHISVIRRILKFAKQGTKIYYLVGNHDDFLRKYIPLQLDNIHLDNKLILKINGKKLWFFHGDVFDLTIQHSKWLAILGGKSYDWLIRLNRFVNNVLQRFNRPKMSLSKKVKNSVKTAAKFINNFENTVAEKAVEENYSYVLCGHIHQPKIKKVKTSSGEVTYMNSGDWIENLTALEYFRDKWTLYRYDDDHSLNENSQFNDPDFLDSELAETCDQNDLEAFLSPHFRKYVF